MRRRRRLRRLPPPDAHLIWLLLRLGVGGQTAMSVLARSCALVPWRLGVCFAASNDNILSGMLHGLRLSIPRAKGWPKAGVSKDGLNVYRQPIRLYRA